MIEEQETTIEEEQEEEQEYIKRYCNVCKKERVFVTSLSPKGDLICTEGGHRIAIKPFKLIKSQFGFKFVKEK